MGSSRSAGIRRISALESVWLYVLLFHRVDNFGLTKSLSADGRCLISVEETQAGDTSAARASTLQVRNGVNVIMAECVFRQKFGEADGVATYFSENLSCMHYLASLTTFR